MEILFQFVGGFLLGALILFCIFGHLTPINLLGLVVGCGGYQLTKYLIA